MIRKIEKSDALIISKAFTKQGWNKPEKQYFDYIKRNESNEIITLVALIDGEFAGYGNLVYNSHYDEFRKNGIPEIVDLNTLIKFRKQGIASEILDELECYAFKVSDTVGIGVGMINDYGAAQRLYAKRGYVPNGKGVYYNNQQVNYFDDIKADDDLVLYLTKKVD